MELGLKLTSEKPHVAIKPFGNAYELSIVNFAQRYEGLKFTKSEM
jgi:hypothetical protein